MREYSSIITVFSMLGYSFNHFIRYKTLYVQSSCIEYKGDDGGQERWKRNCKNGVTMSVPPWCQTHENVFMKTLLTGNQRQNTRKQATQTRFWPRPWPDDLDIRTWPRYFENVLADRKRTFSVTALQSESISDRQLRLKTIPRRICRW